MTAIIETLDQEVSAYLADVLERMGASRSPQSAGPAADDAALANEIFSVLTSRTFCYLGRSKAESYRDDVVASLRKRMAKSEAFRFFYDIGPGYHATTRPGVLPLRYEVGLSELLILSQVHALCRRVAESYAPGARFWLVIDNICGLRTNDIPLDRTEAYVRQLRQLIQQTRVTNVELIVESEEFSLEEYDGLLAGVEARPPLADPSPEAVDNVARFLGRLCSPAEAAERIELYRRTGFVTDLLLNRLVQGVHMTQRATGATLGFRPFPGGDQRTQAGELALIRSSAGHIRPVLLTSRNINAYDCVRLELPGVLPPPITHVTCASLRT